MTDGTRALVVAFLAVAIAIIRLALIALRAEPGTPARLVAELRLAQFAALVLVLSAGTYIGSALTQDPTTGSGLDVALAVGFLILAAVAVNQDPRLALTLIAGAFVAHAAIDLLHGSGALPGEALPQWYARTRAIYDVALAAVCYVPILRRP